MATSETQLQSMPGDRRDVRSLVLFFVLAYAISWAWAIPLAVTGQVVARGQGWPTHYPSLLGPAIAAVVVTALTLGRPGLRDLLGRLLRWHVPVRWWLAALSPLAFLGLALVGLWVAGQDLPPAADFGMFSGTPMLGLPFVFVMITFVGALGEEVGWRGYALPNLQHRFSPLAATLVLAPLWFLWHVPQFFVIQSYREFEPVEYVGMLLGLTCGAVILTWIYNQSGGSLLLVVLWHGTYNFVGATEAAASGVMAAVITTLVMVQGVVLVVLEVSARRRGRPSVVGPRTTEPAAPGR